MKQARPFARTRWFALGPVLALAAMSSAMAGALPGPSDTTGAYVGAEACRPCHPTAYGVWVISPHARAGLVFGMRIGMEMMVRAERRERNTGERFDCKACHAPLGDAAAARYGRDYHAEDGVQCETCHGPGEVHTRIETAEDTLGGRKIFVPARNSDLCQTCHYDEKPFHVANVLGAPVFAYEKAWPRIAHPTPAEERAGR